MTIEISPADQQLLQRLVERGRFSCVEDVLHETLQRAMDEPAPTAEYLAYVEENIRQGLADADAGRTVPMKDVLGMLRARRGVPGAAA